MPAQEARIGTAMMLFFYLDYLNLVQGVASVTEQGKLRGPFCGGGGVGCFVEWDVMWRGRFVGRMFYGRIFYGLTLLRLDVL
jgi:hypothetical protein